MYAEPRGRQLEGALVVANSASAAFSMPRSNILAPSMAFSSCSGVSFVFSKSSLAAASRASSSSESSSASTRTSISRALTAAAVLAFVVTAAGASSRILAI
jgi:hypothetical protein